MDFFHRLALMSAIPFAVQTTPVVADPPPKNDAQELGAACNYIASPGLMASNIEKELHSVSLIRCTTDTANQALTAVDEISVKLLDEVDKIDDDKKWAESSDKIIEWYAHCDIGGARNLVEVWKNTEQCMAGAKGLINEFIPENAKELKELADDASDSARMKAMRSFARGPLTPT